MAAKKIDLLVFVAIVLIILSPCYISRDAQVCEYVAYCFAYCEDYVDGTVEKLTRECCNMLVALNKSVKYHADGPRRYCYCIEEFSNSHYHPHYRQSRIVNMTRICGVHLSFPISERMDCSKVK
ncbi:non-specific lipid-transfer protein 13 [Capsicum chacoense]